MTETFVGRESVLQTRAGIQLPGTVIQGFCILTETFVGRESVLQTRAGRHLPGTVIHQGSVY